MDTNESKTYALYFSIAPFYPPCLPKVKKSLETVENVEIKSDVSLDDIQYEVKSEKKCLIVFTIYDRTELAPVVNALAQMKKEIKERKVIAVVLLKLISEKAEELLLKSGCSDVLPFEISPKAFTYKLNRYLKLLQQDHTTNDGSESFGANKPAPAHHDFSVEMVDALPTHNDFWLFRKKVYAKKFFEKWLIEMIGPSPSAGQWEKVQEAQWKWVPRKDSPLFETQLGSWIFQGNQPEYNWVINRWGFVSENPELSIVNQGQTREIKFKLTSTQHLQVATNSNYAISIFPQLKATYDRVYHFKTHDQDSFIPWADKTNSKDLSTTDWNIHDFSFRVGADAMLECNLKGFIKNKQVELLEYNEDTWSLTVNIGDDSAKIGEMLDLMLKGETLGLLHDIQLRGLVTTVSPIADNELEHSIVVQVVQSSKTEFKKIKTVIENRQKEILSFFKQAKGWD